MHLNIQGTKHPIRPGISLIGSVQNERYHTILLQDRSICPKHASLRLDTANNKLQIMDLCSIQGVAVDQKPIAPLNWIEITTPSRIHLGNVHASVEIENKNKGVDISFLQDEDSTDVIDCSLEETQPLQGSRKMIHPAVLLSGSSGGGTSLIETIATVHETSCLSPKRPTNSFLVPETQQLDVSKSRTNPNVTSVTNDDHESEKEDDDNEVFFIPETQQPEDELGCPSEIIEPILPDVSKMEQSATEKDYISMTEEHDDNSNDAMFNNKYLEQSQNLMQTQDLAIDGAVESRISILPERSVDSISFQEHRNTTLEMSRMEWNESKKDHEQSVLGTRSQQAKEGGQALEQKDKFADDADDRSITPELHFDDDPPVETVEKPDIQPSEEVNRSSKTPDLCFDEQENEDDEHEISLNQDGYHNPKTHRSASKDHKAPVTNVYEMETQAFGVDDPYQLLTQPLQKSEKKLKSSGSVQKQQLADPYEILTQPLDVEKPCTGKHSEHSSFVKPTNPKTQRKSTPEIDYANMPTQQFTPPELLYHPTKSYDEGANNRKKCHTDTVLDAGKGFIRTGLKRESPFKRQKSAIVQSKCSETPEIDYANLPTQLFTPPELLYQPPIEAEDGNKEPLSTSAILIDNDDLLTQPLSPPKESLDTPILYRKEKNSASTTVADGAYDLDTQPLNAHMETNSKRFVNKQPILKLVDIKACHLTKPIGSNSKEMQTLVSDVDENVYDLGKLKLLENSPLPENEVSQFDPQINSTTRLSFGQQDRQLHVDPCVEISPSSSNKENSRKVADEENESYDTEDELCLAATIPIGSLLPPYIAAKCEEQAGEGTSAEKFKIPFQKTDTLGTPKNIRNRKPSYTEVTEFNTPEHPLLYLPKVERIRSVSEQMRKENTTHTLAVKEKPKYHFNDSDSSSSDDDAAIGGQLFKKTNVSVALERELENVREVGKLKKQQGLTDRVKLLRKKDDEETFSFEQTKAPVETRAIRTASTRMLQKEEEAVLEQHKAEVPKTSTRLREKKDIKKESAPQKKTSRTAVKDKKPERSKQSYDKDRPKSSNERSSTDHSKSNDVLPVRVSTRHRAETYKKRMLHESLEYSSESAKKSSTEPLLTRAGRKRKEQSPTDRDEARNPSYGESKRHRSGQSVTGVDPEVKVKERSRRATSHTKKVVGTSSDLFVEQGKTSGFKGGVLGYESATSSTASDTSTVSEIRSNRMRLIFTKMNPEPYRKCIARAGGKIVDIPELATVLVTDRIIRTYKFLCSVAKGIPIVGQSYLDALQKSDGKEHIDPWDHILSDPVKEKRYEFCLRDTLLQARQHKLFQDYTVFVTSSTQPPPSELYLILSCAGAKISKHCNQPPKDTSKIFVISDPADSASWVKYKEKIPTIEIVSAEGFMLSIMQHSIKFNKHRLM